MLKTYEYVDCKSGSILNINHATVKSIFSFIFECHGTADQLVTSQIYDSTKVEELAPWPDENAYNWLSDGAA